MGRQQCSVNVSMKCMLLNKTQHQSCYSLLGYAKPNLDYEQDPDSGSGLQSAESRSTDQKAKDILPFLLFDTLT